MKSPAIMILIIMVSLAFTTSSAFADIHLEKIAKQSYKLGDPIYIQYKVKNDFNKDVNVTLTDLNEINGSGYAIECLQFVVPAGREGLVDLKQAGIDFNFIASSPGEQQLGPAKAVFRNPDLDLIDSVESEPMTIHVENSSFDNTNITQQIKAYNLCNEQQKKQQQQQNQQQQSQPSKEEKQKEAEEEQKKQQAQQQQMKQQYRQQNTIQKKIEQSQQSMNQDAKAIKDALIKQKKRSEAQKQSFMHNLSNNQELQKELQDMKDQGYQIKKQDVNAISNSSGDFRYDLENNKTGEKAQIQGKMEDGKITDLKNTQDIKNDKGYQELKDNLEKQGFVPDSEPSISGNSFRQSFTNPAGESARIQGDMDNNAIKNVMSTSDNSALLKKVMDNPSQYNSQLKQRTLQSFNNTIPTGEFKFVQKPGEAMKIETMNKSILKSPVPINETTGKLLEKPRFKNPWEIWKFIIPLILAAAALLLFLRYKKKKEVHPEKKVKPHKKIDYRKESIKMIEEAEKLYAADKKKDAYGIAGRAIRFYYSYKLKLYKEQSNTKILRILRDSPEYPVVQECLNLAGLVEFAKYKPNRRDFKKLIEDAKKIVNLQS